MDKELASVIKYFAFFDYFPEFDDVYTFFPTKVSKKQLKILLDAKKYTVGEYSSSSLTKRKISKRKLENWRFRMYLKLISLFPQIKLVGLSGSISMMNAGLEDDIDLFIISEKNRLFTARFLATTIAFIMGLKRPLGLKKASDKICLNLFFDENNLKVPRLKQTKFVGHEVLQMKPIINKNNIYERFLAANDWVFGLFPNALSVFSMKYKVSSMKKILNTKYFILDTFFDKIESFLKNLQLNLISRHKTTEIITSTQLWFHPDDFEKKIKF